MSWRTPPAPIAEERITRHYEADIVVVGLGYAGTCAMRAAQEAGAETIAVEMMNEKYYRSYGRDFGHINSKFLESRGVPHVDPLELFNEWMRRAGNRANPELVMKFCKKSGETFDWFTDMIDPELLADEDLIHVAFWKRGGANFKKELRENGSVDINGYRYWNGTAQFPYDDPMGWKGWPTLPDVCKENHKKAIAAGGKILFATEALQLEREPGGRVTGLIARDRKTNEFIRLTARRAVLLSSGDFAKNEEMLLDLAPDITDLYTPGEKPARNVSRDGRGHRMATWVGARMETRPLPTMSGNQLRTSGGIGRFGAVWIDEHGRRFCNEVFGGMELCGMAANQTVRGKFFRVFDEDYLTHELSWAIPAHGSFDETDDRAVGAIRDLTAYAKAHPEGGVWSNGSHDPIARAEAAYAPTPEKLAAVLGLEGAAAENFAASIRRYNEFCEAGRDEDFARDRKLLDPLSGMLFAETMPPTKFGGMLVSVGGLLTDGDQRVLDENYAVIPGLYASGNCCGRRFGTQYFTPIAGVSIGIAATLGREAGLSMVKNEMGL